MFDDKNTPAPVVPTRAGVGTWREWAHYVLRMLASLNGRYDQLVDRIEDTRCGTAAQADLAHADINESINSLRTDIINLQLEIAVLQIKAGLWGAVGAAIPVIVAGLIFVLQRK